MRCPFCDVSNHRVVDSRESREGRVIRRRRECLECGRRFTTYEQVEHVPVMVVKKDGSGEPFDRNKLLAGILRACEKRPIPMQRLEQICDEVEGRGQEEPNREIRSSLVGEMVLARLRDLDDVAYVRFASVYRHFDDIDAFMAELKALLERQA